MSTPSQGPGTIDPRSLERRPRRAAYALPTFFTAGNIFLGYISVIQSFQAAMIASSGGVGAEPHFELAAKAIGLAVFLDGLDGRIARMTHTTSDFGRELDSLADVISFGIAPAVLAFAWGVQFLDPSIDPFMREQVHRAGYFISFLFLLCGSARLARFNVQKNPVPKNPGKPDRKYFVGLAIPAGAGMVASVVYASGSSPIHYWPFAVAWLVLQALLSFLMVSTWRYYSFKDINLLRPRSPLTVILVGSFIYLIWNYSQVVLLALSALYVASGIITRIGGIVRADSARRFLASRSTRLASLAPKTATVALVGSGSLMGREIRDLIATTDFPAHVNLVASGDDESGVLTEFEGEPAVVGKLEVESLSGARAAFLAGSPDSTRAVLALETKTPLIDLTYVAEESPQARLRAPMVEPAEYTVPADAVHVIAHPASITLALILNRLHPLYPIQQSVAHIFEPASERGKPGLDELQQQTVNLLSFKGQPKAIYDAQLAFNMLPRYGDEAPDSLEDFELRIERHLATLLSASSRAPIPSMRLIQAPVFHGHSFSLWVKFEENPGVTEVERVLTAANIDVRGSELEPPNILGVVGQDGTAVGAIGMDRNDTQACWIWAASDNLRLMASNAVAVARQLL